MLYISPLWCIFYIYVQNIFIDCKKLLLLFFCMLTGNSPEWLAPNKEEHYWNLIFYRFSYVFQFIPKNKQFLPRKHTTRKTKNKRIIPFLSFVFLLFTPWLKITQKTWKPKNNWNKNWVLVLKFYLRFLFPFNSRFTF